MIYSFYYCYMLLLPAGKVRSADKLQLKAAMILLLDGLARSKQDPFKPGPGAQYLHQPPASRGQPAGATKGYLYTYKAPRAQVTSHQPRENNGRVI